MHKSKPPSDFRTFADYARSQGGVVADEHSARSGVEFIGGNRLAGLADESEQKEVFNFFFYLNRHIGREGFWERFKENWDKIGECKFSPKEIGAILHRTGRHSRDTEIQGKISDYITRNIGVVESAAISYLEGHDFSPQGLSVSIYSHAVLGIKPSDRFLELWEKEALVAFKSVETEPVTVSNSLYAHAVLGIRPSEELLELCEDLLAEFLEDNAIGERQISMVMYSLGILSAVKQMDGKTGIAKRMAENIVRYIEGSGGRLSFNGPQKNQIFQACQWFDLDSPVGVGSEEDHMRSRNEGKLMGLVGHTMMDKFRRVAAEDTVIFEKLGHSVDGVFEKNATGQRFYIELDGHHHFVRSRDENGRMRKQYDGSTLFQTALARKLAPEAIIIRVPNKVAMEIFKRNSDTQRRDINAIFSSAAYKSEKYERGSFVVCPNPKKPDRWAARRMRDEDGGLTHAELG